jgi:antitoxin CcdA
VAELAHLACAYYLFIMASTNAARRKRGTNLSLSGALVEEARGLGINLSNACEQGLVSAVKAERERRWLDENKEALDSWNQYIAEHGLPLAKHRRF